MSYKLQYLSKHGSNIMGSSPFMVHHQNCKKWEWVAVYLGAQGPGAEKGAGIFIQSSVPAVITQVSLLCERSLGGI